MSPEVESLKGAVTFGLQNGKSNVIAKLAPLCELFDAHEALLAACKRLVSIRETQRKRESEEFHLGAESFMAMWNEADAEAVAAIALAESPP